MLADIHIVCTPLTYVHMYDNTRTCPDKFRLSQLVILHYLYEHSPPPPWAYDSVCQQIMHRWADYRVLPCPFVASHLLSLPTSPSFFLFFSYNCYLFVINFAAFSLDFIVVAVAAATATATGEHSM